MSLADVMAVAVVVAVLAGCFSVLVGHLIATMEVMSVVFYFKLL